MKHNEPISNWRNKRVWVVGASSGIGQALAKRLLALGARVAISARRNESLNALIAEYPQKGLALVMDVSDTSSWDSCHHSLKEQWGGIDEMIFCAADYQPMNAWNIDLDAARRMIDVNMAGFLNGISVILPDMIKRNSGGIAAVASVAGYHGLPKSLVYGPTKAALINMTESLYLDLNPRGISVRLINPGFVKTALTDKNDFAMPDIITPEQAASDIIEGYASGCFEIHFPKAFTRKMKLLRLLPYRATLPMLARITQDRHS